VEVAERTWPPTVMVASATGWWVEASTTWRSRGADCAEATAGRTATTREAKRESCDVAIG
jgi:hypothetical protein